VRTYPSVPTAMTKLLERAVAAASQLSASEQDAIAARILADIEDEREWDRAFEGTTDEQWDRLAAMAREDTARAAPGPLDELVRPPS
jgi:hypothetical protein